MGVSNSKPEFAHLRKVLPALREFVRDKPFGFLLCFPTAPLGAVFMPGRFRVHHAHTLLPFRDRFIKRLLHVPSLA